MDRKLPNKVGLVPVWAGLGLMTLLPGCDASPRDTSEAGPPVVVSTIYPLGDLLRHLLDQDIQVDVVLPPGASPATFDLTPRQLQTFQRAALFVMVGGGLDEWVSDLPGDAGGDATVIRVSEGLELHAAEEDEGREHDHDHGSGNPHIWLDPILVRDHVIPMVEAALVSAFPEKSISIEARADALADSLTQLDREIRTLLEPQRGRSFIATHAAWTYFAARYGLVEAGVVRASPGREPSGREVARLIQIARRDSVTCLFTEPQLGVLAVRALATELQLPTKVLDPLGGPGVEGREGYMELLRFNARELAEGLGGGSP